MIGLQYLPDQIINFDEHLPVYRHDKVKWVEGKPLVPSSPAFQIDCNVQPINGRELLLVPEGERFKESYYIWTTAILVVDDQIVRQGVNLTVQKVENWGNYQRIWATRIDVGPNASDS